MEEEFANSIAGSPIPMKKKSYKTLTAKLLSIYLPLVTLAVILLFLVLEILFYQKARDQLVTTLNSVANIQSTAFQDAIWEYDTDQIGRLLRELKQIPHFQSAVIYDSTDSVLGEVGNLSAPLDTTMLKVNKPLNHLSNGTSEVIGRLELVFHDNEIWSEVWEHLKTNSIVLLVLIASLVTSTMSAVHIVIGRPLGYLRKSIESSREENRRTLVPWESSDELGNVVRAYNEMLREEEAAKKSVLEYQENLEKLVEARTQELEQKSTLLEAVLGSINQGLVAYDNELKLITSNKRFKELRDVPDQYTKPGSSFHDWIKYDTARGEFGEGDSEEISHQKTLAAQQFAPHHFERVRPDGTVLEIVGGGLPNGGFVSTFADITERKNAEKKLADAYDVISSSIAYASRIQRSVLPADQILQDAFLDHFVIWDPRDVVGGDIYWCYKWGGGTLLILGDCTGHGVPGAFMTLISTGALDRALVETPPGNVAGLVQRMHQLIQRTLGQDGGNTEADDGLELGVCYINEENSKLTFAGARFDLFELKGSEINRHRGDKKGIGYCEVSPDQTFREIQIDLTPSTVIYLTTDGAIDQISEASLRGFGKRRFSDLLSRIYEMPMDDQKELLIRELTQHQGSAPRLDDIAIIGFKPAPYKELVRSTHELARPISAIEKIQSNLNEQGIFFCFSGYITEDNLASLGATLRQKLDFEKAEKAQARAVFAIFIEQAQNIVRYSSEILVDKDIPEEELRRGFLAIGEEDGHYFVSCGNLIAQNKVERLSAHLQQISKMDDVQLKEFYKNVLKGDVPEGSKGAGIGFIDIARRAKSGFIYDFNQLNQNYSYFFLKAYI